MNLMQWQPTAESLVEDFIGSVLGTPRASLWQEITPRADLLEKGDAYLLEVELPGVRKEDIRIEMKEGVLTISGSKRQVDTEGRNYHLNERVFGTFRRSFRLSDHVEADRIAANFEHGLLTVELPKKAEARGKFIPVK